MGTDDEEPWKQYKLEVSVVDPVSFSSPYRSSHTTFNIRIKTNHPAFSLQYSEVRRRFSEFKWLRHVLQRHHPERNPPILPSRGMLVWNRFTQEFLESRRADLETFINRIISIPVYLGEKALHLFIQTELSTKEIELNLLGKRDDVIIPAQEESTISPCDSDSNKFCYAEDALDLLTNNGNGSHENNVAAYLESTDVEEKLADGSPWFASSYVEVLEEDSPVILSNDNA
ncbi:sorting nexin-3-like [Hetaerina americana]|uniref:sorting nexin-3-like n=1 Tax=Hetaerina americana TaxID=62018 RepID=UPI003A7F13EA